MNLEKLIEEQLLRELTNVVVDKPQNVATTSNVTSEFTKDNLEKLVQQLKEDKWVNQTPEERTLEATNGKYNMIAVDGDIDFQQKIRNDYTGLNVCAIGSSDNRMVYLVDTRFMPFYTTKANDHISTGLMNIAKRLRNVDEIK